MKSIYVDWTKEFGRDKWDFVGRRVLRDAKGEWSEESPDGISEDEGYPIYNYAYPLYRQDIESEIIQKVCEETSCTIVYNNDDGCYYLALTGCGMDMSQSIALAYMIADGCIDWGMLEDVYIGGPFSVSRSQYIKLMERLDEQLGIARGNLRVRHEEVRKHLRECQVVEVAE